MEKKVQKSSINAVNSTTKLYMTNTETLKLSCQTEKNKADLKLKVKEIVKKNIKTPEKLLDYVKNSKTEVIKTKFADKILNFIGEEEGFITPHNGVKALFLNLMLKGKFEFKTKEMFILRDLPVNIYSLSHQFHKWYGYKMNLPGFDDETQRKFKKIFSYDNSSAVNELSVEDIISLKEAIHRDIEAVDFVKNLCLENESSKILHQKMQTTEGASA